MKNRIRNIALYTKTHPKRFILLAVVILIIGFSLSRNGDDGLKDITVVRGDLVQEVTVIGKTKASQSVDLGFEIGVKVSGVPASLGEVVSRGDILVQLDASAKLAEVARAKANLSEEEVKLAEISRQSTDSSSQARESMLATIRNAYTRVDDAVRNHADQFFKDPATSSTYFDLIIDDNGTTYNFIVDAGLKRDLNTLRRSLEKDILSWQAHLTNISASSDLNSFISESDRVLSDTKLFLEKLALAINSISNVAFEYQTTLGGYKADVSTARTSIATAITNMISAKEKLSASPQGISGNTSSTLDSILAQEARVAQFRASVQSSEADLARLTLKSPINGTVTKQDAKVGEIISVGTPIVSVLSVGDLEIEANVSEVNIGKVNIGDQVEITFDAFVGKKFAGEVVYIDPAENVVDGVVNYKIEVAFVGDVSLIKSGLTANLRIKTSESQGVLNIPIYAVTERDGESFVSKVEGDTVIEVRVTLGFVGNDSFIEVASGLLEGDIVRVGN